MTKALFLLLILSLAYLALQNELSTDFDKSKVMVSFSPYVSVLDKYNRSRYRVAQLVPLVKKVATRFSIIHIKIKGSYFKDRYMKSLMLSSSAVARYNCHPTTEIKNKVQVFLELEATLAWLLSGNQSNNIFHEFMTYAEKVNRACKGTITTILIGSSQNFYNEIGIQNITNYLSQIRSRYLVGFSMTVFAYCDLVQVPNLNLNIDVLLLNYKGKEEYMKYNSTRCKVNNNFQSIIKADKVITSLIRADNEVNSFNKITGLVTNWKYVLTLPSDLYLISFAFDYYNERNEISSNGWWYLLNDTGSTNTLDYGFEEKISVASKVDFEEDPKNYNWLKTKHTLDDSTTGFVLVDKLYPGNFNFFSRVLYLSPLSAEEYFSLTFRSMLPKKANISSKSFKDTKVYHLPILNKDKINDYLGIKPRHLNTIGNAPIKVSVYSDKERPTYGNAYSIDKCGNPYPSYMRAEHMIDRNDSVILFYFYEDESSVQVRATRTVRNRIVLFEKCRQLVHTNLNKSLEIVFASLGYFMVDRFYSVLEMQNYVKYIYLLSDWASNQTNTVVFLGQFEDTEMSLGFETSLNLDYRRFLGLQNIRKKFVGWMSYDMTTKTYIEKNVEAFKLSELHYKQTYNITEVVRTVNLTTIFVIVSTALLACILIIVLVGYLWYRYFKNQNLTNDEIETFYNGNNLSNVSAEKMPYDKEKYEINDKIFKIESEVPLGAGEFGAVYRGIINQASGKLQVAVKTSNPQKIRKSQLTGLLSEIKVLSYIGKHEYITELLGANTAAIKSGKVYIFLEFCHLGSLHKFLQETRMVISSPIQETNVDTIQTGNNYINTSSPNSKVLDAALASDLYRWSTEICNGMAFLAEKHVVHADLATRNVLLNMRREAKICDFGLSRRMYNYTNYVKTQQEPLPWKWMAPEALRDMVFNEKTDVWAFGVTLWEIYSLACNPYAGLSWDINFTQMLERCLRLSEPEYCERDMFQKMQKCWNICPDNRPSFSEILIMLDSGNDEEAN